jgi:Zn-dependent peptidase ImmA (M78 family)
MATIHPEVLRWARETAGLSLADAAHAIGLKEARGESGPERLAKLENVGDPPRPLLLRMVKAYRRPLLVFYLNHPPKKGDRGEDFRTLAQGQPADNPELDALIRDIKSRQGLVRSTLEDAEADKVAFVGTASAAMPVGQLASRMVESLHFSLAEFRSTKTNDDAFAYTRSKIEGAGVFVLLLGNLGSYHTNIALEIFRGFAVADEIAPMIVINDQDARAAWTFTALHELAHLWIGATGISGGDALGQLERYCNDVAGEILLPAADLDDFPKANTIDAFASAISDFAQDRRLSRSMVAYKLLRDSRLTRPAWAALSARFRKEWLEQRKAQAEKQKTADGGPSYYVVRRHRVGDALLSLMRRALDDGMITYTKAGRVLGVKPTNVEPLLASGLTRGLR